MITSKNYILKLAAQSEAAMAYKENMDLSVWQKQAHAKLEELLGLPLESGDLDFQVTGEERKEAYTSIHFQFQSEPGYTVPCTLLIPSRLEKPLPVAICLQGHSKGAHISLGIPKYEGDEAKIAGGRDFAVRAVKEGFCAIALEQRYMGVLGGNAESKPACSVDRAVTGSFLMGRTPIGERVWDIHKLIDVIEKHLIEYVDPKYIICMGNSGGGTAAFYASCYDKRICLSMPSCSVCSFDDSIMALSHCACNCVPGIRKYFDMGDLGCLLAPRPTVIVCGINDRIFPVTGVEKSYAVIQAAYKSVGKEALCVLIKGNGGHQFFPDEAWPVVHKLLEDTYKI